MKKIKCFFRHALNRGLLILLPNFYNFNKLSDVSSIRACRPRIFFINGFLCFLEDECQRNGEGRERRDATSRRR